MLSFALICLAIALFILWQARRQRQAIGLPAGRIIYSDMRQWGAVEQPLYDPEYGLTGRPDYLVETAGTIIPVEVKSSRAGAGPYDSHIFQLAAYCLLVQRQLKKRPPYGILHYTNRTYAIDYTPALEQALLELLEEMHQLERKKELARSHAQPERCRRCGFRSACDQRLL